MAINSSRATVESDNGYERGRTICLTKGADTAKRWLKEHPEYGGAFVVGFKQAIWDYEDANGLPHDDHLPGA